MAQNEIHLVCAHDGGNGYMKDEINGIRTVYPSLLAQILPGNEPTPINVNNSGAVNEVITKYLDNMDITTQSNSLKMNGRFLIGNNAVDSGIPVTGFNVNSTEGKHNSDVSLICLFSLAAYTALYEFWQEHKSLPKQLDVSISKMATALPIDEIKLPGVRRAFINRFLQNDHVVIINNFNTPVTVNLSFKKVDVQAEGVIAQFGLIGGLQKNTKYRNDDIFKEFRLKYKKPDFTGREVSKLNYILLIDVGEGTVDFSVLHKVSPVPQINRSINMGTGNVVESAIKALRKKYPMIGQISRQSFIQIANRGNDQESVAYRNILISQLVLLERLINEQIKTIYSQLNGQISLVVVCGGGTKTLRSHYERQLQSIIEDMSPFGAAPIFWIPNKNTQMLNLDGLNFRLKYM